MEASNWAELTSNAVADQLSQVLNYVPNVLGALIVILIGVIVAWAIKLVIVKGLGFIKLKKYTDAVGLGKIFTEKVEFVELLGDIARWTIIFIFLIPASEILNLTGVSGVLASIIAYIPNVAIAILAVMFGIIIADLAARSIRSAAITLGTKNADLLADFAKWAIVFFVALGALEQLNILTSLVSAITYCVIGFVVIAGGLAFGLGGKNAAAELIADLANRFKGKK